MNRLHNKHGLLPFCRCRKNKMAGGILRDSNRIWLGLLRIVHLPVLMLLLVGMPLTKTLAGPGQLFDLDSAAVFNVRTFGASGDGIKNDTEAINQAIAACAESGGGVVFIPQGRFLSGTIVLKSNVTLYLDNNAVIVGTTDIHSYRSFNLKEDPSHPVYIRVRATWFRSLILLDHVTNVTITGQGTIDGNAVKDVQGEEGWRGPHGILVGNSKNIEISNIRVCRAGNYNILGLDVDSLKLTNLTIAEGSDGIHIRKGRNMLIRNCKIYTSDDAIAGGYWENMTIADCLLNTSCNGIRLIFPATLLNIRDCEIFGPGLFGHRRGSAGNPLITNSLTGILLQPGAWGYGPGNLDSVFIHDIRIRDFQTAFTFVLNKDNLGNHIHVKNLVATGIYRNACSVEAWPETSKFHDVRFTNVSVTYSLDGVSAPGGSALERPRTESRVLPYWGFYARNVNSITMDKMKFDYSGQEVRPAFGFDHVGEVRFNNVYFREVSGTDPVRHSSDTHIETNKLQPLE
jgi:hypothetical protein